MSLLQQIIDRTASLYSLPEVALEVLELTSHPRVDVPALKKCIERDPALTGKILKVVNSSLFGLSRRVADLTQALSLLGVKPLKMLVLGFSLPNDLSSDVETLALSRYWRHALVKAVACRELAERYWDLPGDEPFIAGLLQDIGQLVLMQQLGESYQQFLQQSFAASKPLAEMELEALGFDHAVVSARLLEKWGLPTSLVKAVAIPADAERIDHLPVPERALPQLLHLGELLAQLLTRRQEGKLQELLIVAVRYQDLNYEALQELVLTLEVKVAALGEVLSLYQPDGPPFSVILLQAHRRLAEVAEDVSCELSTTGTDVLGETQQLAAELKYAVARQVYRTDANHMVPCADGLSPTEFQPTTPSAAGTCSPPASSLITSTRWHLQLAAAIEHARQCRAAVSLLLLRLDGYEELVFQQGTDAAAQTLRLLEEVLAEICAEDGAWSPSGEGQFAVWWNAADRSYALRQGRQLLQQLPERWQSAADLALSKFTISIGVATLTIPTRNFPPSDLIVAAQRCLSTAQASGGNCVKSIEV